jgi:predicted metal-dependent peptidase
MKDTAEERMMKAKIKISYSNPFFAYLSLYLTIEEDTIGRIPKNCGMSVSPTGHLFYRKEFVDEITDAQLLGVLKHEILHLGLLHLVRGGRRQHLKWNISTDVAVNTILIKNGDELPKGLKPNNRNQFIIMNKTINDIDTKSAEEIYDELPDIPEQKGIEIYITFDNHEKEGDKKDGKGEPLTESELQKIETEWFNRVQTAMVLAQQRGKLPLGLERYVDKLKDVEINWRVVLQRFIQQSIPTDYTWSSRSKKGYALGIYLPSVIKEKIDIVVGVDTSGSIGQEELTKFLSEIIGIAKTFREVIDMRIMFHDVEVHGNYLIKNGNIPQIMAMTIKGGGGTSHKPFFEKVKKEVRDCKCMVSFTDGYSDIENMNLNDYKFSKLFIINKKGTIPKTKRGEAIFIKLKDD